MDESKGIKANSSPELNAKKLSHNRENSELKKKFIEKKNIFHIWRWVWHNPNTKEAEKNWLKEKMNRSLLLLFERGTAATAVTGVFVCDKWVTNLKYIYKKKTARAMGKKSANLLVSLLFGVIILNCAFGFMFALRWPFVKFRKKKLDARTHTHTHLSLYRRIQKYGNHCVSSFVWRISKANTKKNEQRLGKKSRTYNT